MTEKEGEGVWGGRESEETKNNTDKSVESTPTTVLFHIMEGQLFRASVSFNAQSPFLTKILVVMC